MPFDNLPSEHEPITLEEYGRRLEKRKTELATRGITVEVPRNAGNRRTASKRALLAAIEATGAKW